MQQEEIDNLAKCCLNCIWHDKRNGFCRFNPPSAILAYIKGIGTVNQSIWPKPPIPLVDWCSNFKSKNDQLI